MVKVYQTRREETPHDCPVGTVQTDGKTYLRVAVADGYVYLTSLQLAGKKRMPVADFLRGNQSILNCCVE